MPDQTLKTISASEAAALFNASPYVTRWMLYQRFAKLCAAGGSEVDWRPFQLVADAFLIGERRIVAPHHI